MSPPQFTNILEMWSDAVARFPRQTAIIDGDDDCRLTYAEADDRVRRLRSALEQEFRLRPGDTVAVAMPNCLEYFLAYWAIVTAGGVVVPVNVRLGRDEMAHVIRNSLANILFTHHAVDEQVQAALEQCERRPQMVGVGVSGAQVVNFYDAIESHAPAGPSPQVDGASLAIVMHTSGTTGRPKGAMMHHQHLIFNVERAIIAHSFRQEDVHLLVVPMFHATALYSMLPSSALLASTIVVSATQNIGELLPIIERHRVTTFMSVPTLCHFLANHKDLEQYDLSSLRLIAYAGSPMAPATILRMRERLPGVALHNFFGLTETISMTHVLADCFATTHAESIGRLLPGVYQKIIDEAGNELPPGQVGELCLRADNVIPGYWQEPDRLEKSMVDGWFRTGDLALVDEDGFVFLKGREKEMIIVGGENVYALEVENTIATHPKVLEVAVIGVPATGVRAYLGELVKAVVALKEGESARDLEIKRHCAERLPSYKVPQQVEFVDALPRNASGKVLKRELQ